MRIHWLKLTPFIAFGILALFLWRGLSLSPHELPSVQIGKPLSQFTLPLLENHDEPLFTPDLLKHQVSLLNVWASWCMACNEEQAFLMQLADDGYPIFGLNYKDEPKDALQWLTEWGNPFKAVGIDSQGKVARDMGVYGTPETFLIDKKGIIQYRHVGPLTEEIWKTDFLPIINSLKETA